MKQVRARLVDGQPCLQIIDGNDSSVRMAWRPPPDCDQETATAVRDLFRDMFLLRLESALRARPRDERETLHHRRGSGGAQGRA